MSLFNSIKVTCASRHTQRLHPCKKKAGDGDFNPRSSGSQRDKDRRSLLAVSQRKHSVLPHRKIWRTYQIPCRGRHPTSPVKHRSKRSSPRTLTWLLKMQKEKRRHGSYRPTTCGRGRGKQALFGCQVAAQAASTPSRKGIAQPSTQIYSDLPREWPMARLCISYKQVNRYVRTAPKTDPAKQEDAKEDAVDALTFANGGGMTHGEQTLPINDLFLCLPVQLLRPGPVNP